MNAVNSNGSSTRDYLRLVFRYKIMIIALCITAMITAFLQVELKTPVYMASVKMYVSGLKPTEAGYYTGLKRYRSIIPNNFEILKSNRIVENVVETLKLYKIPADIEKNYSSKLKAALIDYRFKKIRSRFQDLTLAQEKSARFKNAVSKLKSKISASEIENTDMFLIFVTDFNPSMAVLLANSVSRSFVIYDLELQIAELKLAYGEKHGKVLKLKDYVKKVEETLDGRQLSDMDALGPASVKIVEQAQSAIPVSKSNKRLMLISAFITSIFVGVMFAFILDFLNMSVRSQQDIELFLKIPFLGSISKKKSRDERLIKFSGNTSSEYTGSFQRLSDTLYLLMKSKSMKSVLIADIEASEDTTTSIINIANCLAHKTGLKVLIIDANIRKPSVSNVFGFSNGTGVVDILDNRIQFEDAIQNVDKNLYLLPAGETVLNSISTFDLSIMSHVIEKAKEHYDIVIISCADLKNFTDAVILSPIIDGVALVVNEGKVHRQVVKNAISNMEQRKMNIMGVILNNRKYVIPKLIYKLT